MIPFNACVILHECTSVLSFIQSWTERAKGESDPKKRKREDEEQVNEQMESDEGSAKKKKPLDTSAKLSAFAFNKE